MTYDRMRKDYERMRADEKTRIVDEWKAANGYDDLLAAYSAAQNGCDCECDHHPDERGPDCDVCLACRIGDALREAARRGR